ncbi:glycosyltransferase [Amorphus sp. 3PC139-8]|uniref:glycosyltransferase n=1 Tax=Amorphus sp. 3PC139-8 TaxID=2735676 RepID=UPI00345CF88D
MHIVIDLQGAQCESRYRGIGRYALSLAVAIAKNRGDHRVTIALNSIFPASIDAIKAEFDGILPPSDIRVWRGIAHVHSRDPNNRWRREAAEQVFETFLTDLAPDVVLVLSLFEGFADDVVTTVPQTSAFSTAVLLHDLIPLIYKESYLTDPLRSEWYYRKLAQLRRADFLLSNSASSAQEAVDHLGYREARIVNVSGAVDTRFHPREISPAERQRIGQAYGITRSFVFSAPGGFDQHKNVGGLIEAWSKLPNAVRSAHQLVLGSRIMPTTERRFSKRCRKLGLRAGEIVFTGYLPDNDLVALYAMAKLCVFPSQHEGFGLPALEAMACGTPTIGGNRSAVPEVLGHPDALFDPMSSASIAAKIGDLLQDSSRLDTLRQHALKQAARFSWDHSATTAIAAMERLGGPRPTTLPVVRPQRLAVVLPDASLRSGAGHRLRAFLPALSRRYLIDLVDASGEIDPNTLQDDISRCDLRTFRARADDYDQILYCLGGGLGSATVADLARKIPGAVLLTDLDPSDRLERTPALEERVELIRYCRGYVDFASTGSDPATVQPGGPLVQDALAEAVAVFAGSEALKAAAAEAGLAGAEGWPVIAFRHQPALGPSMPRETAREQLGLSDDERAIAVCCDPLSSQAAIDGLIRLEDDAQAEGLAPHYLVLASGSSADRSRLARTIANAGGLAADRVTVLSPAHAQSFAAVCAAADCAVASGGAVEAGESGLVLDLADAGLAVVLLSDHAPAGSISAALAGTAQPSSRLEPSPTLDAPSDDRSLPPALADALDRAYGTRQHHRLRRDAVAKIAALGPPPVHDPKHLEAVKDDWFKAAQSVALSLPPRNAPRQLLVDVSELLQRDARTGVQRVTRSVLREWLEHPPAGFQVQPVYATPDQNYRYATRFTLNFLGYGIVDVPDSEVDFSPGDIFCFLDLQHHVALSHRDYFQLLRSHGVRVHYVVHDLLPILLEGIFPQSMKALHEDWLAAVAESDGAFCVSRAVANELADWIRDAGLVDRHPFHIGWFHHGADFSGLQAWTGLPADANAVLGALAERPTFLMVGTIEPRKGHAQTLDAFEALWARGIDVNLAIVGKKGWLVDDLVKRMERHPERGKRLFWLSGVSDEYLERIYDTSVCLLAASRGEGFGLPLIESAHYKLPILARDLPVFREVAGDHASFFTASDGKELAVAVENWLQLYRKGEHPRSDAMPYLTWSETAARLARAVINDEYLIELKI